MSIWKSKQPELKAYITELLTKELLNDYTDWGIEFSNGNDLLREVVHTAVDMIKD